MRNRALLQNLQTIFLTRWILVKEPLPERGAIIERLLAERFLVREKGSLHITNVGAIACAKEMSV